MDHINLEMVRRLLFMTASDAARHLAATPDYPDGVSETTWNRWETGKKTVPEDVCLKIMSVTALRKAAIMEFIPKIELGEPVTVVWQSTRPKHLSVLDWHISRSIAAEVVALGAMWEKQT